MSRDHLTERTRRGLAAEDTAWAHLERRGLRLIERNYRCKGGEIDLIAMDDETLVFVEVRLRASERFGGAAASIDWGKRRRLVHAAEHYLTYRVKAAPPCRFDAVLVSPTGIEWIRDAFPAE